MILSTGHNIIVIYIYNVEYNNTLRDKIYDIYDVGQPIFI